MSPNLSPRPLAAAALLLAAPAPAPPELMMMTGLPIVWGEKGAFDPGSRPAQAYRLLQQRFRIRLLDTLDGGGLEEGSLLLLAQPPRLSPAELAAVDSWVRDGGRALVFADPELAWPSELPLGDIRRPPPAHLLAPLIAHWGLALEPGEPGRKSVRIGGLRLVLESPGQFAGAGPACAVGPEWLARCRIGAGQALVIADADLFRDALWFPEGADNGHVVAGWLDSLAGIERPASARPAGDSGPRIAGLLVLGLLFALAIAAWLVRRRV